MNIREQVVSRAANEIARGFQADSIHIAQLAGEYFDVAVAVGADDYTAAHAALNRLGDRIIDRHEVESKSPHAASNQLLRDERWTGIGYRMRTAAKEFRKAGDQAAFDRLVAVAELAA